MSLHTSSCAYLLFPLGKRLKGHCTAEALRDFMSSRQIVLMFHQVLAKPDALPADESARERAPDCGRGIGRLTVGRS